MLVTIHQPEHMPWLGFFHKMAVAEKYVLLDNVQFTKNNWQNRNKIPGTKGEPIWLTVPVQQRGHLAGTIADMEIEANSTWKRKYLGRILDSYRTAPYFRHYFPEIESIIQDASRKLVDLNVTIIEFFRRHLEIHTPLLRATSLVTSGKRSELLFDICRQLGATTYLSGPSGRDYLDLELFKRGGIQIDFHSFKHPKYESPFFAPGFSSLDLLMWTGPNSRKVLCD